MKQLKASILPRELFEPRSIASAESEGRYFYLCEMDREYVTHLHLRDVAAVLRGYDRAASDKQE